MSATTRAGQDEPVGPYASAALDYWRAGWHGTIPLPARAKHPVPRGWTGAAGHWPSRADLQAWLDGNEAGGNLALRLPAHVIGVDVDDYDGKGGGARLGQLEEAHGPLPASWRSTSRNDGMSGIRLFRVPEGLRWPGDLGAGIEIIQMRHRYVVAAPSVHPEGGTYRWITPDGATSLPGTVPGVDGLPDLPDAWIQALTGGELAAETIRADLDLAGVGAWLAGAGPEPCELVGQAVKRYLADLGSSTKARHSVALNATARLAGLHGEGHQGVPEALGEIRAAWLASLEASRKAGEAEAEWRRLLAGAVAMAAAGNPAPRRDDDPCCWGKLIHQPVTQATMSLAEAHEVFRHWLGASYDLIALDAVLAAAAVEQLDGDPIWLLLISGSGNAKTETIISLVGAGGFLASTIKGEAALLSATARKERSRTATGGLLREIGERGLLVVKDFTSIMSMSGDARAEVLGALREIYDGQWVRRVGVDGGTALQWKGRIVLIAASTTAYDTAHGVIATMGDRFALIRMDSTSGRAAAGRQALSNVGQEIRMRADLARAAGGVLAQLDAERADLDEATQETLLGIADLVTRARTAVERDYQGNVIDAHAPEMPTRFAKMLGQVVRGGLALGMDPVRALAAAVRVGGDSMPPLRLAVLADVAANPGARTGDVRRRLAKPWRTVDRALQELHVLGLVDGHEIEGEKGWRYEALPVVDLSILDAIIARSTATIASFCRSGEGKDYKGKMIKEGPGGSAEAGDEWVQVEPPWTRS